MPTELKPRVFEKRGDWNSRELHGQIQKYISEKYPDLKLSEIEFSSKNSTEAFETGQGSSYFQVTHKSYVPWKVDNKNEKLKIRVSDHENSWHHPNKIYGRSDSFDGCPFIFELNLTKKSDTAEERANYIQKAVDEFAEFSSQFDHTSDL